MSKARDWPGGWQMPGARAVQHLQMPHPLGLTRRANAPQLPGGGWAQVELTDALSLCYNYYRLCETEYMLKFHFNCYDKGKKAKEKNALSAAC